MLVLSDLVGILWERSCIGILIGLLQKGIQIAMGNLVTIQSPN